MAGRRGAQGMRGQSGRYSEWPASSYRRRFSRQGRLTRRVTTARNFLQRLRRLRRVPSAGPLGHQTMLYSSVTRQKQTQQRTRMTTLIQQIEEMRIRMNDLATKEQGLVRALGDALARADQTLLQDVRSVAAEHEVRRGAILNELQMLAARMCALHKPREPFAAIEEAPPPLTRNPDVGSPWRQLASGSRQHPGRACLPPETSGSCHLTGLFEPSPRLGQPAVLDGALWRWPHARGQLGCSLRPQHLLRKWKVMASSRLPADCRQTRPRLARPNRCACLVLCA